ncbi:TPA: hypothetical protein I9Z77_002668 [Clostridium perfringens]|nr:hypothetical protein [Clostridium perfringens]
MDNNFFNDKRNLILLIGALFYFVGMLFNISWLESLSMGLTVLLYFYSPKILRFLEEFGSFKGLIFLLSLIAILSFTVLIFNYIGSNFSFNKVINYLIIITIVFTDVALLSAILNKLKKN